METASGQPTSAPIDFDRLFAALMEPSALLNDEDLETLIALRSDGRRQLWTALGGLDVSARFGVLARLVDLAEVQVRFDAGPICLDCLQDPDASVRALATSGLQEAEEREALIRLQQLAADDPDALVRAEAIAALRPWVLRAEFEQLQPDDRSELIATLRELAEDGGVDASLRGSAIESLGALSEEWVRELIHESFAAEDQELRLGALRAMGWSADPYWLPTVLDALEALDDEERAAAAFAAGEIEDEDAVPSLRDLLEDESMDVVLAAVAALGEIGGPLALEALEAARVHPEAEVRDAARAVSERTAILNDPLGLMGMQH